MNKKVNNSKGFTLVEMLIVVAIIATLVAIAIPVFSSYLDRTRAATCSANCSILERVLVSDRVIGNITDDQIKAIKLNKANGYKLEYGTYECPSGGELYATVNNDIIDVRCTYHDDGQKDDGGSSGPIWSNESTEVKKLWEILKNYNVDMDSGATSGTNTNKFLKEISDNNIDFDSMKVTSWKFKPDGKDGNYFQWTTADISDMNVGDSITVIRYRLDKTYGGVYSVWKGKVGNNGSINIVEALSGAQDEYTGKLTQDQKKDVQNVIPYYNDNRQGYDAIPI